MSIPRLNTSFEPAKEDLLNFKPYAQKVQNIIRGLSNTSESIVIGIDGEWGSGKSTFSNMVFHLLEQNKDKEKDDRRIIKMKYNPWLYSNEDEMLFDFLNEMKKCFYRPESSARKIGKAILKYSKYLKSVRISGKVNLGFASTNLHVEPEKILKEIGDELVNSSEGLIELKENINELLEESDIKLVIFIDDLDRLDKNELFTILKLIKLTASFNHVVFIVAMDNNQAANSIGYRFGAAEDDGHKFLEKIINIPISLPLIEDIDRRDFVNSLLNKAFNQYQYIDVEEKNLLLSSLTLTKFKNPREAIRVVNSFTYSLMVIGDEVNAHDLFWIEYLKVICPALHRELKDYGSNLNENRFYRNRITLTKFEDGTKSENTNRDFLTTEYSQFSEILDLLFPIENKETNLSMPNAKQHSENKINRDKRISYADHYEKYFSFHTARKVSQLYLNQLLLDIKSNNFENAKNTFNELIKNVQDVNVLRLLMEYSREPKDIGKVPKEVFEFLEYYHSDCRLDGIENVSIADIAKDLLSGLEETDIEHYKVIKRLCANSNLASSVIYFNLLVDVYNLPQLQGIADAIIQRIKNFKSKSYFELLDSQPYFLHEFWKLSDSKGLMNYILKRMIDLKQIGHFLKLFVKYYNGEIYGMITINDFKRMVELIDVSLLVRQIKLIDPDIKTPKDLKVYDERSNNSDKQLAEQFLYWANQPTNPNVITL